MEDLLAFSPKTEFWWLKMFWLLELQYHLICRTLVRPVYNGHYLSIVYSR